MEIEEIMLCKLVLFKVPKAWFAFNRLCRKDRFRPPKMTKTVVLVIEEVALLEAASSTLDNELRIFGLHNFMTC